MTSLYDVINLESSQDVNQNVFFSDAIPMESQVGGHGYDSDQTSLGMLRHKDGYALKPILNPEKGKKEIEFYEELKTSNDPVTKELNKFVPKFSGVTKLTVHNKASEWIVLKDATYGMAEPCIIDVKIGKQTWNPTASEEKKMSEMKKYKESKRDCGFCIPGFQVYKLDSGNLVKYGKDYGRSLNGDTVRTALKTFLNGDTSLSRCLVLEILGRLWKILRWFRSQRKYHFYGSSILIVYDAKVLRHKMKQELLLSSACKNATIGNQLSLRVSAGPLTPGYNDESRSRPTTPTATTPTSPFIKNTQDWNILFDNVCKTHSLVNNYDKDLQSMKENYSLVLENLVQNDGSSRHVWVNVKMIDFAHVFYTNNELDNNYLEGLENLVNIFEEFLFEADR